MTIWILVLIGVAGVAFWYWRTHLRETAHPQEAPKVPKAPKAQPTGAYHAVSINHRKDACAAAIQLNGKRFLSREAPSLPLSGCHAAACRCKYDHHEDRREGDRRSPQAIRRGMMSTSGDSERRMGVDRRKSPQRETRVTVRAV